MQRLGPMDREQSLVSMYMGLTGVNEVQARGVFMYLFDTNGEPREASSVREEVASQSSAAGMSELK
jgi:hypothetical protein